MHISNMRGSRNFRQGGGGPGQSDKKSPDNVFFFFFLVLSLFYRSKMVNFNYIYHFSRFQRGSNIFQGGPTFFQGGSNCLFPIETHITCDFPGGGGSGPPVPPSGSALVKYYLVIISYYRVTQDRRQSKTLILSTNVDKKITQNRVWDCHLSIKNTVSSDVWSTYVDCSEQFDCCLSDVRVIPSDTCEMVKAQCFMGIIIKIPVCCKQLTFSMHNPHPPHPPPPPPPHTHTHHVLEKATNHNSLRCIARQNPYETPDETTKQNLSSEKSLDPDQA